MSRRSAITRSGLAPLLGKLTTLAALTTIAALPACSSGANAPGGETSQDPTASGSDAVTTEEGVDVAPPDDDTPPGPDLAPAPAEAAMGDVKDALDAPPLGVGGDLPEPLREGSAAPGAGGALDALGEGEPADTFDGAHGAAGAQDLLGVPDLAMHTESISCRYIQWWNSRITYQYFTSYGWWDTDLAVGAWTPVQLRHASRLVAWGVYGWGYMPTFIDTVTGYRFRFLHLHPTAKRATWIDHVYPSGYVVGYSGGNTYDTGYPRYSTGAHLCVNTRSHYRTVFPYGTNKCY